MLVTLRPATEPDVALVKVGYNAVAVDVSLVMVTPDAAAAHVGIPPATVRTCPVEPIPILARVFVALAYITSPVVYVANPVPPEVAGKVPLVNDDVDVAYKAPPEVKLVRPVPP